jgi:myosin heavy subunit
LYVNSQLLEGASSEEKRSFALQAATDYRYLSASGCFKVEKMDDREEFEATVEGMKACGYTTHHLLTLFYLPYNAILTSVMYNDNK